MKEYSEKNCPSSTLSITNPTAPHLESNTGHRRRRRFRKPAINRLGYGTAIIRKESGDVYSFAEGTFFKFLVIFTTFTLAFIISDINLMFLARLY
jgi:hypothetical protein